MKHRPFCFVLWFCKQLNKRHSFEYRHTEDLQNCVETERQLELLFQDSNKDVYGDGDPDLRFYGILRRAIEAFDSQILLDPFEEKLHVPAAAIQLGDGQRRQRKIVGQKHERAVGVGIVVFHSTELVRVILALVESGEHHRLVVDETGCSIDRMGVDSAASQI